MQLFNVRTNQLEEATLSVVNGEYHATFAPAVEIEGEEPVAHFVKFPAVNSQDELLVLIAEHNRENVPVVTNAELAAKHAAMEALLEGL